jgi:hypothetical protein
MPRPVLLIGMQAAKLIDMYMSLVPLISYDLGNLAYRTICDVTRRGVGKQWTVGAGCGGVGK